MKIQFSLQRYVLLVRVFCFGASALVLGQDPATPSATTETQPAKSESKASEVEAPTEDAATEEAPKTQTLLVNEGLLRLTLPAIWQVVEPRNRLIEVELAIPPAETEEPAAEPTPDQPAPPAGRLTMMAAGGDVDSNIRRWVGQFRLGRDADGKDAMRREDRKLRRAVAHVLDIAGTYFDSPKGPFGPKVELPDYRMIGAIIEIEGAGKYFVKFYGPAELVETNREAFEEMLASLEVVEPTAEDQDDSPHADSSEG